MQGAETARPVTVVAQDDAQGDPVDFNDAGFKHVLPAVFVFMCTYRAFAPAMPDGTGYGQDEINELCMTVEAGGLS
ncbi:hypothetical protein GHA01_30300 [Novacetimonas hansenii]|uniref:Uncharacterized protein n=1 Tax=Novacetimonas hansenii TaxID=436 RepID=A0ABQ0SIV5_NOVHA|nr:hypothetical protein Gaha_0141_005 [Novacetimonas hansenii JCM 7643]GBQ57964.1 hypothetical protein AA0243_1638 [Novacetimonas hansenii NRIC 0243]GEC65181.1 hypothetical protein GHA01_30300 [Novacetimonas hansenii]